MTFTLAYIIVGLLLIGMALTTSTMRRLPLSSAMIYVAVGLLLGPSALGFIEVDPVVDRQMLERLTEIAVIISLFTAGLKLRRSLRDPSWWLSIRLAFVAMAITVGLVALVGVVALGLPVGVAVLLGAILAPTDPVLASDVQVRNPQDRDPMRFALTSEAGLNDGTAFPFVMLGLGLLGFHHIGDNGLRWLAVDVVWAVTAGLAVGALLGTLVGYVVVYLRRTHREALGLDDFLALGLIALAYGVALLIHAYGFLSVFAAGLAVRRIEVKSTNAAPADVRIVGAEAEREEDATHPEKAPAYMTEAVLAFNEQIDRIGAMAVLLVVGAMFSTRYFDTNAIWFVPLLLLVIRPVAVWIGLFGSGVRRPQKQLIGWFGVRGIGSIYYLSFAIGHGLIFDHLQPLVTMTISVIATSVIVHGISVTPLMTLYERRFVRTRRVASMSAD